MNAVKLQQSILFAQLTADRTKITTMVTNMRIFKAFYQACDAYK